MRQGRARNPLHLDRSTGERLQLQLCILFLLLRTGLAFEYREPPEDAAAIPYKLMTRLAEEMEYQCRR